MGCAIGAAVRWGLLLSLPVVVCAWARPDLLGAAAWLAVAVLGAAAAVSAILAWRRSRALLGGWPAGAAGGVFHDELLTWLELDGARGATPPRGMFAWLERDVHQGLRPNRHAATRAVTRWQLGRWRWLSLPLAMLLLAWLLSDWITPPWRGAFGGGGARPDDGAGGSGQPAVAIGAAGVRAERDQADPPDAPRPEDGAPPDAPAPTDQGDESESDPPEEVPPLLDLPDDRRFVLPDFIDDGPTRRARMHIAELAQPEPGGASAQRRGGGGGGSGASPPAPAAADEVERAAEKAQRSRHVPPAERAIVRRFFDRLQRQGKR